MLFLVFFIVVALLVALKGNKKFILFFMAFYPVLPDYFAIELGGGLPLLKASRILLLILMLCVCFHNKKIHLIRQPLKVTGLYWPLFIYFAARILANRDAAVAASTGDIPSVRHRVQHAWRYAWWTVLQVGKKVHERLSK